MSKNTKDNTKETAKIRYDAQKIKRYGVACHIVNDFDIIDYIENFDNKSDFIKKAIRYYIKNVKE